MVRRCTDEGVVGRARDGWEGFEDGRVVGEGQEGEGEEERGDDVVREYRQDGRRFRAGERRVGLGRVAFADGVDEDERLLEEIDSCLGSPSDARKIRNGGQKSNTNGEKGKERD